MCNHNERGKQALYRELSDGIVESDSDGAWVQTGTAQISCGLQG